MATLTLQDWVARAAALSPEGRAFIAGEQGWGCALAVAERGAVIAAAMHLPARGETFAAGPCRPAFRAPA